MRSSVQSSQLAEYRHEICENSRARLKLHQDVAVMSGLLPTMCTRCMPLHRDTNTWCCPIMHLIQVLIVDGVYRKPEHRGERFDADIAVLR